MAPVPGARHPPGAVGIDAPWLLDRCQSADFASASELLRLGPLAGRTPLAVAPPNRVALSRLSWRELTRVPVAEGPALDLRVVALLTGLAASGDDLGLIVACDSGGTPAVWLGLPVPENEEWWAGRLLAPGHLFGDPGEPADTARALCNDRLAHTRAAHLRVVPAHASNSDEHPVGLLERLLNLPTGGWALVVHGRPVSSGDVVDGVRELHAAAAACAANTSSTLQADELRTLTVTDAAAERVRRWIELTAEHADEARTEGSWAITAHYGAASPGGLAMLAGGLHGTLARPLGGDAAWHVEDVACRADAEPATALLSSRDVAGLLRAPSATLAGLDVAEPLPAARRALPSPRPLQLGTWMGVGDPAGIDVGDLEGHAFVAGVTGSGKSTTVARLLLGLWNAHEIPFLVLDPVKSDYEQLAGVVRGGLQVLSARDLRLNALAPWPGFDAITHLGHVATAFRGSFSMPSPVPYVLSQVFDALQDRATRSPAPTLHDLRAEVEALIPELGYQGELEDNIRAALGTRLAVLTSATRAERLAADNSRQVARMLTRPTVVHLADLGDDEERAFTTTLLMLYVAEAARTRGATDGVVHVTVLEEAHRVLPEPSPQNSGEDRGDAAGVAARLLTQLLAEIRSYGEALVIVDQSPSAVARDVVRNTNVKIAHRVVDPVDREVLGGSLGLTAQATGAIGRLRVGDALITTRRMLDPQALSVARTNFPARTPPEAHQEILGPTGRTCCAQTAEPEGHHLAEAAGGDAEHLVLLALAAEAPERPPLAFGEVARCAARHPGAHPACLVWVGLRRALWRHVRLGHLDPAALEGLLTRGLASWQRDGTLGGLPAEMAARAARSPLPLTACDECPAPCRARALILSGAGGRLNRTRAALRHAAPGAEHHVLIPAATDLAVDLRPKLGNKVAKAAGLCMVAHAAHREGLGDSLTLARLEAMNAL